MTPTSIHAAYARLSPREREILVLIADWVPVRDIAALLDLAPKTVDAHKQHISAKLDTHSLAGMRAFERRRRSLECG